jgi:hypothetical protein
VIAPDAADDSLSDRFSQGGFPHHQGGSKKIKHEKLSGSQQPQPAKIERRRIRGHCSISRGGGA